MDWRTTLYSKVRRKGLTLLGRIRQKALGRLALWETGAHQVKIFLQRVRQAGASNSRSALFIIFATIFVLGAALPPASSKSVAIQRSKTTSNQSLAAKTQPIVPAIPPTPPPCTTPPSG